MKALHTYTTIARPPAKKNKTPGRARIDTLVVKIKNKKKGGESVGTGEKKKYYTSKSTKSKEKRELA